MRSNDGIGTKPEALFSHCLMLASLTLAVCVASLLLVGERALPGQPPTGLPRYFAIVQDIPVATATIIAFLLFTRFKRPAAPTSLALKPWHVVTIVLAMTAAAWIVRIFVLFDFEASRDEQMAAFDATIFARGQLFAKFPIEWREWYHAVNTLFILPIGDREAWVSAYLPGNAVVRTILQQVMAPSMVSPALLLIAGIALWRSARLLWPESVTTQSVVLLLFAGSSQAIFMAGTCYAMTPHLTANLCWLWLFLQRKTAAHAAAIVLGFVATGLHQPIFHPLFVMPFLDILRRERNWRLLSAYVLCYGAIGIFWLLWPSWVSSLGVNPVPIEFRPEGVSYLDRLRRSFPEFTSLSLGLMGVNLLRFFTWQHLMLLPLMLAGLRSAYRTEPVCRALAIGMALLLLAMLVLMPTQTHGWGYRYLNGFIGSAVLIAGFGWRRLEQNQFAPTLPFLLATAASILVLVPLHARMARPMIEPYATASRELTHIPADIVIVDTSDVPFGADLVRNSPDLLNRPITMLAYLIPPDSMSRLCAGGRTLAFADSPRFGSIYAIYNMPAPREASPDQQRLQVAARAAGCRIVPPTAQGG